MGIAIPTLAAPEGQFIGGAEVRCVGCVERRGTPIAAHIEAVQHHLRLVVGLRPGGCGVVVEALRPGVVGAELQVLRVALGDVDLQRVVAGIAVGQPEECAGKEGVGPAADLPDCSTKRRNAMGDIQRAYRDEAGVSEGNWHAAGLHAAGDATSRSVADLRDDGVGIDIEKLVISKRSHVADAQRHGTAEALLDREVPLLHGGNLGVLLHALGSKLGAGLRNPRSAWWRDRRTGIEGCDAGQAAGEGDRTVERRIRVELEGEGVQQRIVHPEARVHGRGAMSEGIPRQRNPGAEELFRVVLGEGRVGRSGNPRCQRTGSRVNQELRGPVVHLVPSIVELMAQAKVHGQIAPDLDGVFHIPGAQKAPPSQLGCRRHHLEAAQGPLLERSQAGKAGLA